MSKRNANIDLARTIATLFVIVLHILGQGGILSSSPTKTIYLVTWFLEISTYCAVNLFALISGYVMVNKGIKLKNIISLWFQVLFYSILISGIFFVFIPETRSVSNFLKSFLPILGKQWWYTTAYFGLFFFIPILNSFMNNTPQKKCKKILIVFLFGICFLNCIIPTDAFALCYGYSALWLIIMYLFGAYIKKYNLNTKITALKSLFGFFAMVIITLLSKVVIHFSTKIILGQEVFENIFISYTSITIVFEAIFILIFCLNIRINKFFSKIVIFLAPATLGVYLIHVHPFVFDYLLNNAFVSFAHKPIFIMLLLVLLSTFVIFILCTVIELLRIKLFKLIKVNKLCEYADNKLNNLYSKLFKE